MGRLVFHAAGHAGRRQFALCSGQSRADLCHRGDHEAKHCAAGRLVAGGGVDLDSAAHVARLRVRLTWHGITGAVQESGALDHHWVYFCSALRHALDCAGPNLAWPTSDRDESP